MQAVTEIKIIEKNDEKPVSVPTELAHKPIYAINGYAAVDGYYKNDTDAVGISVGKAQWDNQTVIPSVKVWRYKGRWSRQSEETTLTRALDMAMLVVKVLDKSYNGRELETVKSIHGILPVEEMDCDINIKQEFDNFLHINRDDIEQHLKLLYDSLSTYYSK